MSNTQKEQPELWRWVRIHKDGSETTASDDFHWTTDDRQKHLREWLESKGAELALRRSPADPLNLPIKYQMDAQPEFKDIVLNELGIHAATFDWPEMSIRTFQRFAKAKREGHVNLAHTILEQERAFLDHFSRYMDLAKLTEIINGQADAYVQTMAEALCAEHTPHTKKPVKKPASKKKNKSGHRQFNSPKLPKMEWMDADDFANWKPQTRSLLLVNIKRADIEKGNTSSVLERLHIMTDTAEAVMEYRESMTFQIDGYNFDSRELPEIPEVRAFMAKLVSEWPHWMWFLCRGTGSIALLFSLICEVRLIHGRPGQFGTEFLDIEEVQDRFKDMLDRGCALYEAFDISEEDINQSTMSAVREIMPD